MDPWIRASPYFARKLHGVIYRHVQSQVMTMEKQAHGQPAYPTLLSDRAIRVLITDEQTLIRTCLHQIVNLSPNLVVVGEAANADDAFRLIATCNPDVALLDLSMPGMNGMEMIGRFRAEYPRLPLLVHSLHKEQQYALRALNAGALGYLTKDCTPRQLLEAIHRVATGGRYVDPSLAAAMATAILPRKGETPHDGLSKREFQVFRMLASGTSVNHIAATLSLSANTISTHKHRLMLKLGEANNAGLVRYAVKHRLVA